MRVVSIRKSELQKFSADKEMVQKSGRPCVLIVRLKYKGKRYDFAVPLRSNINPSTPKKDYFPLPANKTTKPKHRHGIHYAKMFPVDRTALLRYRTDGNPFATMIKGVIDKNEKQIIAECQQYLNDYAKGIRTKYSTDIDLLISIMSK